MGESIPPVLFLDVDGVLASQTWLEAYCEEHGPFQGAIDVLEPRAVHELTTILRATGCQVVLSSVWRQTWTLDTFVALLIKTGMPEDLRYRFIGCTPYTSGNRGSQIQAWLGMERFRTGTSTRFCILDDSQDMGDLLPYLVKCHYPWALTASETRLAVGLLNGQPLRYRQAKTIQAASCLRWHSGEKDPLRLGRYLYLVDRQSLLLTGTPITGDQMVRYRAGPILRKAPMDILVYLEAHQEFGDSTSELSDWEVESLQRLVEDVPPDMVDANMMALPEATAWREDQVIPYQDIWRLEMVPTEVQVGYRALWDSVSSMETISR